MRFHFQFLMIVVFFCTAQLCLAQQGATAGMYGGISDSQGAVIPGAKVTAIHAGTNQVRTVVTNQAGEFSFPLLPVGEYRIAVEQPGFKKYQQTGILLQVNDNARVDIRLEVGEVTTEVRVESAGVVVETSNATIKE